METTQFVLPVRLPSLDEFADTHRSYGYGDFARNEGNYLFELIMTPVAFNSARVATLDLGLPAVAGIAKRCHEAAQAKNQELTDRAKQFIGVVTAMLMESNGFLKAGKKRAIPHPAFTKGEMYIFQEAHVNS